MPNEPENEKPALLPLDAPRVINLNVKGRVYTWRFRRITLEDWRKYFTAIVHQTLRVDGVKEDVWEDETAKVELTDAAVTAVEGYGDLSGAKNWKSALPLAHRVAAAVVLRSVGRSKSTGDESAICDLVEVRLDGCWSAGEDGKMTYYEGLVHRFRQPSVADLKRFNFEAARVRVVGDARNGVSVYPPRQAIAMKIYDDLIESVEGYSVAGAPLVDVDAIKREMDGAHKAEAAMALFSSDGRIDIE